MSIQDTYEIIIDWSKEDGCYVCRVPDLPGCMAHGGTRLEALKFAEKAIAAWIRTAQEDGETIPEPRSHLAL
ncbi:MAG: type II toxin-antitoxin system HicB family antitoxin [Verrucomicrobiae bacterium]|nr:type II toxin-antitoxin system HicB family antitoxin [Verrucomicrobiae bacterium]